jgi:hypothetical protein
MAGATEVDGTGLREGDLVTDLDAGQWRRRLPRYGLKVYREHVESAEHKRTRDP